MLDKLFQVFERLGVLEAIALCEVGGFLGVSPGVGAGRFRGFGG